MIVNSVRRPRRTFESPKILTVKGTKMFFYMWQADRSMNFPQGQLSRKVLICCRTLEESSCPLKIFKADCSASLVIQSDSEVRSE